MTLEIVPDDIHELEPRDYEDLDPQELLEHPEGAFVEKELSTEQQREAVLSHESVIEKPDLFIGSGNDAIVFELPLGSDSSPICLKHIWESVNVEMRGKQFYKLSERLQQLRRIQEYFEKIREEKRKIAKKGSIEFVLPNKPIVEAGLQTAARTLLEKAGYKNAVPAVKSLIRIETKGEGDIDGVPYVYDEIADIIAMEKINGKSIQDFILNYDLYQDVIDRLDPVMFRKKLREMLAVLHENNLTHQDVTNRNIMIDFDTCEPVIIDFGKASYRGGNFSKEQELDHVDAVCRTLTALKQNPEEIRKNLKKMLGIAF